MGRRSTKVDYRQLYKDHYHIEFGKDMVVHHIDFDRTNNNIDNLLLLPNRLHTKYHYHLQLLSGIDMKTPILDELRLYGPMVVVYGKDLRRMADVLDEIYPWIEMKNNFDRVPYEIYRRVYCTDKPITEKSVR